MSQESITRKQLEAFQNKANYFNPDIPSYYDSMYLDNYEPWQIKEAARKKFYSDYIERVNATEESLSASTDEVELNITTEVK